MAYLREYYPSDGLKIINRSEGRAGMSGKAAHAISRHLRHKAKGGEHQGVGLGIFLNRWEENPYTDAGDMRINSGWLGKGDMALLLSNVLNTPVAQRALNALDRGAKRASVTAYLSDAKDFFGNRFGGAVAELRVLPQPAIFSYHNDHPQNPLRGQLKSIKVQKPKYKGVLRLRDIVGAVAVLDDIGGDNPHLQTFYPLFYKVGHSFAQYTVGTTLFTHTDWGDGRVQMVISLNAGGGGGGDDDDP